MRRSPRPALSGPIPSAGVRPAPLSRRRRRRRRRRYCWASCPDHLEAQFDGDHGEVRGVGDADEPGVDDEDLHRQAHAPATMAGSTPVSTGGIHRSMTASPLGSIGERGLPTRRSLRRRTPRAAPSTGCRSSTRTRRQTSCSSGTRSTRLRRYRQRAALRREDPAVTRGRQGQLSKLVAGCRPLQRISPASGAQPL
jgi:hypothetical protein